MTKKRVLNPDEKMRAAFAVICMKVKPEGVAQVFGCDPKEVEEACAAGRKAFGFDVPEPAAIAAQGQPVQAPDRE
jgi:hypothetical protein